MSFNVYLKSQKNILIVWFLIHGFALFVNYFGIMGDIGNGGSKIYYLFTSVYDEHSFHEARSNFYPFVEIIGKEKYNDGFFYGIFNEYDFSEFIFYSVIIFVFFYAKFEYENNKLKTKPNSYK